MYCLVNTTQGLNSVIPANSLSMKGTLLRHYVEPLLFTLMNASGALLDSKAILFEI